jgi:hypothetical protein
MKEIHFLSHQHFNNVFIISEESKPSKRKRDELAEERCSSVSKKQHIGSTPISVGPRAASKPISVVHGAGSSSVSSVADIKTTDVSLSSIADPFSSAPSTPGTTVLVCERQKHKDKKDKKDKKRDGSKKGARKKEVKDQPLLDEPSTSRVSSRISSPSTSSLRTVVMDQISDKIDPITTELLDLARQRKRLAEMKEEQIIAQNAAREERVKRAAQREEERKNKEMERAEKRRIKEEKEKELLEKLNSILS